MPSPEIKERVDQIMADRAREERTLLLKAMATAVVEVVVLVAVVIPAVIVLDAVLRYLTGR